MIIVKEKYKYLSLWRAYKWADKWRVKLVWSQEDITSNSVELRKNKSSNLNAIETYSHGKMLELQKKYINEHAVSKKIYKRHYLASFKVCIDAKCYQ